MRPFNPQACAFQSDREARSTRCATMRGMVLELVGGGLLAAAGTLAYGVRGRSAAMFGPSVCRGSKDRPSIALTFDDGPSESTPEVLDLLERYRVPATFFQCGVSVRRLPAVTRQVYSAGHELGNHSDTHPLFCFKSAAFMDGEISATQDSIEKAAGIRPRLLRLPFGARWFGLRHVQEKHGLMGVMWTVIGRDWTLPGPAVARRLLRSATNGAIVCLHDGRDTAVAPDIRNTIEALRALIPSLMENGYRFETVSQLLCPTK